MSLQEKINTELKNAMIAKDADKLTVIRSLKSALKYSAIEKKVDTLSDLDALQVIQKQIKQRRESIDQFQKAGRNDLSDKELIEVAVLETFLPRQMSDADLETLVRNEAQAAGASTKKDFGRMMKLLTEKVQGQADSKRVSEVLGKILVV